MAERPTTTAPPTTPPVPQRARCANCGAELHGPYCHACGQPTRHVLKHLPALVHDGLDLFFDIDGRIIRTLPALFLKPGFLAREYFAGRRMRYIPPFRLMFFLSVLAFLVMQFQVSVSPDAIRTGPATTITGDTPAEVRANLHKAEQPIIEARRQVDLPVAARSALDSSQALMRDQANARLHELGAPPLAAAGDAGKASPATAARYLKAIREAPDMASLTQRRLAAQLDIQAGLAVPSLTPPARTQLDALRTQVDAAYTARKATLQGAAEPAPAASAGRTVLDSDMRIAWLPGFLNQRLQDGIAHARANWQTIQAGSPAAKRETLQRIVAEALSLLPQALFVMLPLFAILLKIAYLLKRRLYIEHLIVAMYSHAFIYLSLLLWGLLALLRGVAPAWAAIALGWLNAALLVWMPVYLLLMQKRVYAQGWPMTLLKYAMLGLGYSVLVSCAVASAVLVGFAS